MGSFLISAEMYPFTGAILFVAGLVVLEIIALLLGGSVIGMDSDGPDLDVADGDFDLDAGADLSGDFDGDFDAEIADADAVSGAANAGGFLGWIGLRDAPFVLWLAGVATAFGVSGYALQLLSSSVLGGMLPAVIAALIALIPSLWGGKFFAAGLAKLAPKTETSAVSRRHLSGRRGVITQGSATRGRPAECRITDRHGNSQYVRAEPQKDGEVIPQGSDVIVLRPKNGIYPVIAFDAG